MKLRELGALLALAAIWGVSFLLIRIAAPQLGPITLVNARMLIASSVLLLYAIVRRHARPALRASWKAYLILGLLNSALPLTLEAIAVLHLNASLAAVLAATAPLFTALAATLWLREPLTLPTLAGLLLGLAGVGVLVGWSRLPLTITVALAVGASLLSALFYALAGIYAKMAFRQTPALSRAIGQELLAGIVMLPLTLAAPPSTFPALPVIGATVTLALVMTAGGNLLYFYLIDQIGPTKTQSVAFLVPAFALLAGAVLLGEPLMSTTLLGLVIILASVVLVTEVRLRMPHLWVPTAALRRSELGLANAVPFARSAALPTPSRPFRAWPTASAPVYDRHSTRRHTHERSPAMCA